MNISYPPGYDRSRVSTDLLGGSGGGGGPSGFPGTPGRGGSGGQGGDGVYGRSNDGSTGPGGIQQVVSTGSSGSQGASGTVTDTPVVTIATNKQVYLVGEAPVYSITGAPNTPIYYTYVFARGADNSLVVNRMVNGGWTGWQSAGGGLRSDPVVVAPRFRNDAGVHVAVRGTDDGIHLNTWTHPDGMVTWRNLGGSTGLTPEITSYGNIPEVFGVDRVSGRGYYRVVPGT